MKIAVADKEINKELRVRTLVINFAHKKVEKFLTRAARNKAKKISFFFM